MSTTSDEIAMADVDQTRTDIDWSRREPVSFAIQTALAKIEDRSVTELDPLADYVDPDALEAFFDHGDDRSGRRLSFEYDGHVVHVDGAGHVAVE